MREETAEIQEYKTRKRKIQLIVSKLDTVPQMQNHGNKGKTHKTEQILFYLEIFFEKIKLP